MSPAEQAAEKIYACPPHFSVHYSAGRRLRWTSAARADYAALLLLGGSLRWQSPSDESEAPGKSGSPPESGEINEGSALLAAPGDVLQAASTGNAKTLLITLSPVFVLDCAARALMTQSDSVVAFRTHAVERDERLA